MMTSTIANGVWRSHSVLDESEPDSSPEAVQQFKKMRSSSSLNSLRMSLRKRLPLKPVQSNVNISENPTWESLQMNQKASVVRKMTRSAKNSIGNVCQKFQRSRQPRQEFLVMTPGRTSDGEECDCIGTSQTPKRSAARTTITPRRTPRSTSKRTPRGACTPDASDSAVRTVKTRGTRRQLVRMAALRSPFASPNTMNSRRQFDEDLDCVSKGLRRLKRLSQAFDDAIGKDDRVQALEHYKAVMSKGYSSTKINISRGLNRASIRKRTQHIQQTVSSWTDVAMSNIRKAT
ncbi:protein PIMREG-like isoform X1 [Chanodichthys erythropterus]|uniref:protein PIMREG-like isoform X1 n=1 Tax=Chanodichthys erythropterus TaxID=933992 RepID=UPI00351EDCD9